MSLKSLLLQWKTDPSFGPNFTAWQEIPARDPTYQNLPPGLDPRIRSVLKAQGIQALYTHQKMAWDSIQSGKNVALVTGTSSGKTLAYSLPILDKLIKEPKSRALFLYPTKALAHDQLDYLAQFSDITTRAYDGDTPKHHRKAIRSQAQIVITNPDMLHLGILPYHIEWEDYFSNLQFIVIDEIHTYRGVFGSQVANVLRRLKRITDHYCSQPLFILTSATIGNPASLAKQLINAEADLIDKDFSSRGKKYFLIFNPPVVDEKLGLRASMQRESLRLAAELISNHYQTILFGRSRRSIEFMLNSLWEMFPDNKSSIKSYRSGYLPAQRRKIEKGLQTGSIMAVAATNALELGIDIGGMDAAILAGYPGTIAGTLQQAGRSGRTDQDSLSVLVVSSTPIDQYLALHPEFLFSNNFENGLIDPDNLLIVLAHMQCSLYELPFSAQSRYGNFTIDQTQELLAAISDSGKAHRSENGYFWMSEEYPAAEISLRTTTTAQISLHVVSSNNTKYILGTVDKISAYWMVHQGAVYLHEGETFLVNDLDLVNNQATLAPISNDYYTEAERQTTFTLLDLKAESRIPGALKAFGDIQVTSQVTGYKKINWNSSEVLGHEILDLPPTSLPTQGFWITVSEDTEAKLQSEGLWTSSPNDYGPDWENLRSQIITRDQNLCQNCSKSGLNTPLHVHHKLPMRSFLNIDEANQPGNLISLCSRCHQRAESVVKMNSGIHGLGYVLHGLAPLHLMCAPGDIGIFTEFRSPFTIPRPIALIFEQIPAGIGFSRTLFEQYDSLIKKALELVSRCLCRDGCPSCVGPGGEKGSGGKKETLALLKILAEN